MLPEGGGWLMVEFGGDTKDESDQKAKDCMEGLRKLTDAASMKLFTSNEEETMIWEIRESGLGATADVPTLPLMWGGWEDSAVPPNRVGGYAARNPLERMEVEIEEPQKTCCGMAGSFGFEEEHYDISQAIAELDLFRAIRPAPKSVPIVADGFSCRTQIEEGTRRQALHMAEFILLAYEKNGTRVPVRGERGREVLESLEVHA